MGDILGNYYAFVNNNIIENLKDFILKELVRHSSLYFSGLYVPDKKEDAVQIYSMTFTKQDNLTPLSKIKIELEWKPAANDQIIFQQYHDLEYVRLEYSRHFQIRIDDELIKEILICLEHFHDSELNWSNSAVEAMDMITAHFKSKSKFQKPEASLPKELPIRVGIDMVSPSLLSLLRPLYPNLGSRRPAARGEPPRVERTSSTLLHMEETVTLMFTYSDNIPHSIRMSGIPGNHLMQCSYIEGYRITHAFNNPAYTSTTQEFLFKDYPNTVELVNDLFNTFTTLSHSIYHLETQFTMWHILNRLTDAVMLIRN